MKIKTITNLKKSRDDSEIANKALDVICGMEVDPKHTRLHVEHSGEVYYFCNVVCRDHFVNDPQKYVG